MSDLHLEMQADTGDSFWSDYKNTKCDALIIAGYLDSSRSLAKSIEKICGLFPRVIYVPGNHEYYHSSFIEVDNTLKALDDTHDNFHMIERKVLELNGDRIIGCTLWFSDNPSNTAYEMNLTDFILIRNFKDEVYRRNRASIEFLRENVKAGDIVITHHMPSEKSVSPEYKASDLNRFFVCDMEDLILERKPSVWIHGHTHDSCDYKIGDTRVICNPFGYVFSLNKNFKERFVIGD